MLLSLLLILQAQFPGAALAGHPAATLTWAERRAEAPGPARAADSLRAILRTRPDDPAARLALGTLKRFRGRIKEGRAGLAAESATDVAIGRRAALTSGLRGRDALCQIASAHLLANFAAPTAWMPLLDSAEATSRGGPAG